ncbi:MAG: hypothetical protein KF850_08330 [Labilithrix sp.]|nr:hypothetical protein [Labilithrix sp.]MBX3212025.1 hypothetical protein [Labilithrix sp.]
MSTLARTLPLLLLPVAAFVGCDSTSAFEDCDGTADAELAPGRRHGRCPASVFPPEDARSREVFGVVRRGEDAVGGALVRAEPSPGFASSRVAVAATTVTNAAGVFSGLRALSPRYDLLVKLDRSSPADADVLVFRGLAGRYVEPSLEGPLTATRAYTARVDVAVDRAVPAGHSLAFFASGVGVHGVTGDLASGLTVLSGSYTSSATLHVVEHEMAGGLAKATAYGTALVRVDAGVARFVTIPLQPIPFFVEPQLIATSPAGASPVTIDVAFAFSRTSGGALASIPAGGSASLPIIPNAGYTYRGRATKEGAALDTGEIAFDVLLPTTEIELPSPPAVLSPLGGEARATGESLLVDGDGVFEHILVPAAGGATIRIIAGQREVALPDVTPLGLAAPSGEYDWTVRSYPTARFAEQLAGLDARRNRPMTASPTRRIFLR